GVPPAERLGTDTKVSRCGGDGKEWRHSFSIPLSQFKRARSKASPGMFEGFIYGQVWSIFYASATYIFMCSNKDKETIAVVR
ncbi:MAG: hypothetical protein ACTSQI_21555, partial [Candidatus Helarchaeota archaeon]